jgi:hypothetical protein
MTSTSPADDADWRLPGLGASGPDSQLEERLALFGQFVGDWKIEDCRFLKPDGEWGHLTGELHWRWILRGRAVQDVWTLYDKSSGELAYEGTTIRFYDRRRNAWSSNWISATHGSMRRFTGHEESGRIVLDELVDPGKPAEHWVFTDITADSFRWYAEEDRHDGRGWTLTEEMHIRRQRA